MINTNLPSSSKREVQTSKMFVLPKTKTRENISQERREKRESYQRRINKLGRSIRRFIGRDQGPEHG